MALYQSRKGRRKAPENLLEYVREYVCEASHKLMTRNILPHLSVECVLSANYNSPKKKQQEYMPTIHILFKLPVKILLVK